MQVSPTPPSTALQTPAATHTCSATPGPVHSVTLMGTTATDRVIVEVTMTSGDQYTIIDQYYPFPGSGNTGQADQR